MRLLNIDIETAPNTAHVWGLFKQNIGINQLLNTGRVMCFAAKWYGEKKIEFRSEFHDGTELMIQRAWELLDEADAVLSYNGKRFDMPTLNREFLKYQHQPPAPYKHVDLLETAKREFRFASNKLDHLSKELGIGEKVRHEGHDLWIQCMAGDASAWSRMRKYNRQDVVLVEELYERLRPWIKSHPNHAMFRDDHDTVCTNCGSDNLQSRGFAVTRTQKYRRFQCQDCGTWMRTRYTEASVEKRRATLIQES